MAEILYGPVTAFRWGDTWIIKPGGDLAEMLKALQAEEPSPDAVAPMRPLS